MANETPLFGTGREGFGTTWGVGGSPDEYDDLHRALTEAGSRRRENNYAGIGPKQYRRTDERIFEDVCTRLTDHPALDASEMEVHVAQGEVTLTGSVDSRRSRRLAEDIAESVRGVRDIHNQLRVSIRANVNT
jgi:osmotically-inducible protein OsmY